MVLGSQHRIRLRDRDIHFSVCVKGAQSASDIYSSRPFAKLGKWDNYGSELVAGFSLEINSLSAVRVFFFNPRRKKASLKLVYKILRLVLCVILPLAQKVLYQYQTCH